MRLHPCFRNHGPALRDIGSFAGVPLTSPDGVPIGILALLDPQPRPVMAEDLLILEQLGRRGSFLIAALTSGVARRSSSCANPARLRLRWAWSRYRERRFRP